MFINWDMARAFSARLQMCIAHHLVLIRAPPQPNDLQPTHSLNTSPAYEEAVTVFVCCIGFRLPQGRVEKGNHDVSASPICDHVSAFLTK